MTKTDLQKIEAYLRRTFGNPRIGVRARPRKTDSADVYIGDEFIGTLTEDADTDPGDASYSFQMSILEIDLEG